MTMNKELLAMVYALEKFRPYIFGSNIIFYTNRAALKYLLSKKEAKSWLIGWVLLLQEFNFEIKNKKGIKYLVVDHLSHLHILGTGDISDTLLDEHLLAILSHAPWLAYIVNFLVTRSISEHSNQHKKNNLPWTQVLLLGRITSIPSRIRWDHLAMHSRGGAMRHFCNVSLIYMQRTFFRVKDRGQDPTKQLLADHHL